MKNIKEIKQEIEEAKDTFSHQPQVNKKRPYDCSFCHKQFTSRGISRHIKEAHGIIIFDFGIREATLTQTIAIAEMIVGRIKQCIKLGDFPHIIVAENLERVLQKINGTGDGE